MLDGLSMSDDEKSNAKMEDGEICDKDDSSASSWKTGQAEANGSSRSRISNKKSRKLKKYFKQLFNATLSNVSNKTKFKSKTYDSQQAKLTDRLKSNKNKDKTDFNVDLLPILMGELKAYPANPEWRKVKILVDSGSSASIVHERFVYGLPWQKSEGVIWNTMGGQFKTVDHYKTQLCLPELNSTALINIEIYIINLE